jgi:methylmalonyl-CoA mutase N-terminal domain/subunit
MHVDRLRTIRRYAEFSSAEVPNELVILMLASGQLGLLLAFDLAPH